MIRKNKKGFTLLELIVVVTIVAILLTGAVETYKKYQDQARFNKARATLSYLISQSEAFRSNTGFFLPNLQEMNISFSGVLEYAYSINCLGSSGPLLGDEKAGADPDLTIGWSSGDKTCGEYEYSESDAPTYMCLDCETHAGPKDWMGVVLTSSYCGAPSALSSLLTESSSASNYDVRVTGNLLVENPCREKLDDPGLSNYSDIQETRNNKFRIKGSYGICSGTRIVRETELREGVDGGCAHSQEYVYPTNDGYGLLNRGGASITSANTDIFSAPDYLRIYAVGCKDREGNCQSSHERIVIYLDTKGNMGEYTLP